MFKAACKTFLRKNNGRRVAILGGRVDWDGVFLILTFYVCPSNLLPSEHGSFSHSPHLKCSSHKLCF